MWELLSFGGRVGLFTDPARAYQYAHERGIWFPVVRPTLDLGEVVPW